MKTTFSIQALAIGLTAGALLCAAPHASAQGRVSERSASSEKARVPAGKDKERKQPVSRERSAPIDASPRGR